MKRIAVLLLPMLVVVACATTAPHAQFAMASVSIHPPRMDWRNIPTPIQGPFQQPVPVGKSRMFETSPATTVICDTTRSSCRHGLVTIHTSVLIESLTSTRVRGQVTIDSEVGRKSELSYMSSTSSSVHTETIDDGIPTVEESQMSDTKPFDLSFGEILLVPSQHGAAVEISFLPNGSY